MIKNNGNNSNKLYIGAHASIGMGMKNALKSISFIGGNAVQVFLKNPRGRIGKEMDFNDAKEAKKYLIDNDMFLVGHCSYLLNFVKPYNDNPWAVESLIDDMVRVEKLGGTGIVLHIGKLLKFDKKEAFENIVFNINKVLEKTPKNTFVIWENTAGQGTEIGFKIEELCELYNMFADKSRIKFCLDTCHAHAAGYDLSTKEGVNDFKNKFDELIGWDEVVCIHLNDCKKKSGCRVDRHEDIGFGTIGDVGISEIVKLAYSTFKPLILETPTRDINYIEQIEKVKRFI